MPYIQFNDQQFPLTAEELTVGAYDGATVRLSGNDASLRAVLVVGADGTGLVRRGGLNAEVFVNGVQLGAEPSPLLHGDKLSLGSYELRYGDDVRGGSTQFVSGTDVRDAVKARGNAPSKPTTDTRAAAWFRWLTGASIRFPTPASRLAARSATISSSARRRSPASTRRSPPERADMSL
jgi:hypothetical protein